MPVQAHSGLVWLFAQRFQALGPAAFPGKTVCKHLQQGAEVSILISVHLMFWTNRAALLLSEMGWNWFEFPSMNSNFECPSVLHFQVGVWKIMISELSRTQEYKDDSRNPGVVGHQAVFTVKLRRSQTPRWPGTRIAQHSQTSRAAFT